MGGKVTNMQGMFRQASAFNSDLSKWNVAQVTNMLGMFSQASVFNQDLSKWNVGKVTNMEGMFRQASAFNQILCGHTWVDSEAKKRHMFTNSTGTIAWATPCGPFQPQNRIDLKAAVNACFRCC